jgi:NDP-sugar pyrophosphorylase family protein
MKTHIIKSEKDLEKFKDDYGYHIDGNAEFEYSADFTGRLLVDGYLEVKAGEYIKAGESIEAGWYIKAGWYIEAGWYIKAGRYIEAGWYIEAGSSIEAGGSIEAGSSIEAGGSIEAGVGIVSMLYIKCKGELKAGLRIFSGICNWRDITDEDKKIECSKLTGGEIVFGDLVETGEEEKVTIKISKSSLQALKDSGIEVIN